MLPGSAVTVGLDIGYGVVKAITDNRVITFPSVMGHAREIKFQQEEITTRYPGDQITDDDGEWFVGELALPQLPELSFSSIQLNNPTHKFPASQTT